METKEIVDLIKVRITYLALTRTELQGDHYLDTMQNMASRNGEWEVGFKFNVDGAATRKPASTKIGGILRTDKEKVYALSWF